MGPALIAADGWKLRYFAQKNIFQLYYLKDDPAERNNLADRFPEKVKQLRAILQDKCSGDLLNGWFRDDLAIRSVY